MRGSAGSNYRRHWQGLYNPDEYRKSQEYLRVSTYFGLVENTFSLSIILIFWFIGGIQLVGWSYPWLGFHPYRKRTFYILASSF